MYLFCFILFCVLLSLARCWILFLSLIPQSLSFAYKFFAKIWTILCSQHLNSLSAADPFSLSLFLSLSLSQTRCKCVCVCILFILFHIRCTRKAGFECWKIAFYLLKKCQATKMNNERRAEWLKALNWTEMYVVASNSHRSTA